MGEGQGRPGQVVATPEVQRPPGTPRPWMLGRGSQATSPGEGRPLFWPAVLLRDAGAG